MKLAALVHAIKAHPQDAEVVMELVGLEADLQRPGELDSYRGYYEDLAIGWGPRDLGSWRSVEWLVDQLRTAVGDTFEGCKGGYYTMREDTKVWAACTCDATGWAPCEVVERDGLVVIRCFDVERG